MGSPRFSATVKGNTFKAPAEKKVLGRVYKKLLSYYGHRDWWPGDSPFEIAVGAILTQHTNWANVERVIANLKQHGVLNAKALHEMHLQDVAALIRPSGYYNIKAKRLKAFIGFLMVRYDGDMALMSKTATERLRIDLLAINGVGQETADAILLYALGRAVFVIDAYTKRVFSRHGIMDMKASYEDYQDLFHGSIKPVCTVYNEYHALIVSVGKEFCRPEPRCEGCPLNHIN
jgi:endonuclease-3 related protein